MTDNPLLWLKGNVLIISSLVNSWMTMTRRGFDSLPNALSLLPSKILGIAGCPLRTREQLLIPSLPLKPSRIDQFLNYLKVR